MTVALTSSVFARPLFYATGDTVTVHTGADAGGDLALSNVIKYRRAERGLETGGADGNGYDIALSAAAAPSCWQVSNVATSPDTQSYYVRVDLDADAPYAASDYAGAMMVHHDGIPTSTVPGFGLWTNSGVRGLWNDVNHIIGVDPKVSGSIAQTGPQSVTSKGIRVTFKGARTGGHESACVVFGYDSKQLYDQNSHPVGVSDVNPYSVSLVGVPGRRYLWETSCTWRVPMSEALSLERWARARMDDGGMAFVFPMPKLRTGTVTGIPHERAVANSPAIRGGLVSIRQINVSSIPKTISDADVSMVIRQWDEHTTD